jgi:hypothetical protein
MTSDQPAEEPDSWRLVLPPRLRGVVSMVATAPDAYGRDRHSNSDSHQACAQIGEERHSRLSRRCLGGDSILSLAVGCQREDVPDAVEVR